MYIYICTNVALSIETRILYIRYPRLCKASFCVTLPVILNNPSYLCYCNSTINIIRIVLLCYDIKLLLMQKHCNNNIRAPCERFVQGSALLQSISAAKTLK